jgi:xylulokinase
MFLVNTIASHITIPELWGTVGAFEGTRNLAGSMATSGVITIWLRELVGSPDYSTLLDEAAESGPGTHGLLLLPYFAGERTPIADPDARGIIAGLTIEHARGDLYRAALEATAMGVWHNVEVIRAAGGTIEFAVAVAVAVGGGTQGDLLMSVVSDVTGLTQEVRKVAIGASYGAAFLAAKEIASVSIVDWNPVLRTVVPNVTLAPENGALYSLYCELYSATTNIAHTLAERQKSQSRALD